MRRRYVKVSSDILTHRLFVGAFRVDLGVYVAALVYCGAHLSDGFVPDEALPFVYGESRDSVGRFLESGAWERGVLDGKAGIWVVNYLKWQTKRAEVEAKQAPALLARQALHLWASQQGNKGKAAKAARARGCSIEERTLQIIRFQAEHPDLNQQAIATRFGVSQKTVSRALAQSESYRIQSESYRIQSESHRDSNDAGGLISGTPFESHRFDLVSQSEEEVIMTRAAAGALEARPQPGFGAEPVNPAEITTPLESSISTQGPKFPKFQDWPRLLELQAISHSSAGETKQQGKERARLFQAANSEYPFQPNETADRYLERLERLHADPVFG